MTAATSLVEVGYAVLACLTLIGFGLLVAGFTENRADRRVDEQVRRKHGPGGAR